MSQVVAIRESGRLAKTLKKDAPIQEINYQGLTLPAVKLSRRLAPLTTSVGSPGHHAGYMVIVGTDTRPWAMLVDHVESALHVPRTWIHDLPACCGDGVTSPFNGVLVTPSEKSDEEQLGPDASAADRVSLHIDVNRLHPDSSLAPSMPRSVQTKPMTMALTASVPASRYQILNFLVSGRIDRERPTYIGASFAQILEITSPGGLIHVPYAPNFVEGITIWRNRVAPVINLAHRLGLPPMPLFRRRWVFARATKSGEIIGFAVDPSIQVLRLPVPHRPSSFVGSQDLIRGVFELKDRTLVVPDFSAVALYR
jgi:purine-binding chemotaxis protein CheW